MFLYRLTVLGIQGRLRHKDHYYKSGSFSEVILNCKGQWLRYPSRTNDHYTQNQKQYSARLRKDENTSGSVPGKLEGKGRASRTSYKRWESRNRTHDKWSGNLYEERDLDLSFTP